MPNHLHISERFLGGNDITHFAQTFNTHVSHQFYYCTSRLSLHYPLIGKPTKHSNSSLNFQFASNYKVARKLDSFFTCVLTITIPSEELNRPNEKSVFTDWSLLLRINHQLLTVSCISLHHRTRSWIWIRTLSSLSLLFPLSERERADRECSVTDDPEARNLTLVILRTIQSSNNTHGGQNFHHSYSKIKGA